MLDAHVILRLHAQATVHGHDATSSAPAPRTEFEKLVVAQHQANFDLWHREDEARDPSATDHSIALVKHEIDRLNQRRNDLAEQLDLMLVRAASMNEVAPLHSESPGLMIDRLSILALKIYHTREELHRSTEEHRERNKQRLAVLDEQRSDLADCLDTLWAEAQAGTRRFKLYRQLKMYNDPTLNPVLYRQQAAE